MRVSVICPSIDLVTNPLNDLDVNGANIALWIQLRTYANNPAVECLELFLTPRDFTNPEKIRLFGEAVLEPENRGKGKLEVHSIYALGDVWADARPRILHTDDLWLLSRDRHLRDTYAKGVIAHVCDTHCIGHFTLHRSLNEVANLEKVEGDTIIACSRATAAVLRESYDLPYEVKSYPRRIDCFGLAPATPDEKQAARAKLHFPKDMVLGLYIGRVTPAMKGELALLVDALVGREGGLVVTGVSNMAGYPEVLRAHAKKRGVSERVFIHGRFAPSERGVWYQACDVFLFPGDCLNEAFGQTTIEALACGLPIIQSGWDGLKDTLTPEAGYMIPAYAAPAPERLENLAVVLDTPSQFLALAQAIVIDREAWFRANDELMGDEGLRGQIGLQARALYESTFLPTLLEEGLMHLLNECLEGAKSGRRTAREVKRRPLPVDYSRALDHYATVPWNPSFAFEETSLGQDWRKGEESPSLYEELEPLLDMELMVAIQERVARGQIQARALSKLLCGKGTTERDVVYHAMFLAKQGFLKLIVETDHSDSPSV